MIGKSEKVSTKMKKMKLNKNCRSSKSPFMYTPRYEIFVEKEIKFYRVKSPPRLHNTIKMSPKTGSEAKVNKPVIGLNYCEGKNF